MTEVDILDGFGYRVVDEYKDLDGLINQVEDQLVHKKQIVADGRSLMSSLLQLKRKREVDDLSNDLDFKASLSALLNCNDFTIIDDGYNLISSMFIPCSIIKTRFSIHILDDIAKNALIDLGWGITWFKIEKSKMVKNVYCKGRHPNINKETGCFCLDPSMILASLTLDAIHNVYELLSQFNLSDSYLDADEYLEITEVIGI